MKNFIVLLILILANNSSFGQETFTRKDSLQGGLRFERTCFDVLRYDLNIKIDIENKYIVGYNQIFFKITTKKSKKIQLDLYQNMQIDSIVFENKKLNYKREFNAVFIDFPYYLTLGFDNSLKFYY
ncbi:MAG: M1 family peptidase, partial [Flavobacterium sp.]|nr:M1 family peptidase [Flavobacterium sp.]